MSHQGPRSNEFRSRWRETQFMVRQLCRCVSPTIALAEAIREWPAISAGLSEAPRARTRQTARVQGILETELG